MKTRPLRKDFAKKFPNVGFYLLEHHIALEKWAEEAENEITKLKHRIQELGGELDILKIENNLD